MRTPRTHSRPRRVAAVTAVVVAGSLAGVIGVGTLVDADKPTPATQHGDSRSQRAIAEYARANGLTGLSPASLTRQPNELAARAAALAAFAEYARANGLTGLSPASLTRHPSELASRAAGFAAFTDAASGDMPSNAGTVRVWNANALAALGSAGQPPNVAVLHMAMVQGAVYDAVNSIDGGHQPFLAGITASSPTASMEAAVATAAYRVLDGLGIAPVPALPASVRANLLMQYIETLDAIHNGSAKTQGIEAGAAAAAAMLTARRGDGRYEPFPLTVGTDPGEWRPIPPANAIDPNSWISEVDPFTLMSTSQFRTPGPRNITSAAYAHEYDEVKRLGALNSPRTPEQDAIARLYNVNPLELLNRTFRTISEIERLSLADDARLFGMLNIAGADAIINCWDDKRFHSFWRPTTAIHEGDNDGNQRTIGDTTWTPLETNPPYSDHTSGYNCMAGALMNTGKAFFGRDLMDFRVERTPTTPAITREYHRLTDVVDDTIDARVYQGLHFRSADVQGARLGRHVAEWVDSNAFRPVDR